MSRASGSEADRLARAAALDGADPLAALRERFAVPRDGQGRELAYFCGNSLGLMPREAARLVEEELASWADRAVEGHFEGERPWYSYAEPLRAPLSRLVGAREEEVVVMNTLTTNLHLLMISFYRPAGRRRKILIEDGAFPSDTYAVRSQLELHGLDPERDLLLARPREGEVCLRSADLLQAIAQAGEELALVLLPGVQFYTGQVLDIAALTRAAHAAGALAGFDLAHAAGNVPLELHDWDVDFAVWCSYKYLNGGPGALAGAFVHERHGARDDLPRLVGWWGNDPETRFEMDRQRVFVPRPGAGGWQLSNPPILAMTPLVASLALFDAQPFAALRERSLRLTGFLRDELLAADLPGLELLTPGGPEAHGCQLSLRLLGASRATIESLRAEGVVLDYRPPSVLRAAPVPLYSSFADCARLVAALERSLQR